MCVTQSHYIEMADAARPQGRRDNFFADVEILRSLPRAAAKSTTVD
jgi:hypothetical protein